MRTRENLAKKDDRLYSIDRFIDDPETIIALGCQLFL